MSGELATKAPCINSVIMESMTSRPKQPVTPADRKKTIRQGIQSFLEGGPASAREISAEVGIPEKEVYEHLEHIQKTAHTTGHDLIVTPAECRKCGFAFRKRERLKKPGRCPVCRSETIKEPLFSIR
jgi:predicted Zn-ribbon and HTH transcriptional regulator